MKVFVKQNEVTPVRVGSAQAIIAVTGAMALGIRQEQPGQPLFQFLRDLLEIHPAARAGGAFDLKIVPVKVVIAFERLNEEVVYRKPDWAAPVGVATEKTGVGLPGHVAHLVLLAFNLEDEGILLMEFGE
jgi:hypothetical protein